MDISVQLETALNEVLLELGRFEDVEVLVDYLNSAWPEQYVYSLKPDGEDFVFLKTSLKGKKVWSGPVYKKGAKAVVTPLVHDFIMEEYHRYLEEKGEIPVE